MDLRSQQQLLDQYTEGSRRQYARLLNMERRELQSQKEASDAWVKYIYLLLETTMERCKAQDTLFYNLDEFGQTMLLREEANKLRAQSDIEAYEVIYDPLDAAEIVRKFSSLPIGQTLGLSKPAEELSVELETKYGKLLKSVPVSLFIFRMSKEFRTFVYVVVRVLSTGSAWSYSDHRLGDRDAAQGSSTRAAHAQRAAPDREPGQARGGDPAPSRSHSQSWKARFYH